MAPLLHIGQVLKGRNSTYTISKEIYKGLDQAAVYLARNQSNDKCIVKSIRGHPRLQQEALVLKHYQKQTPFLRPLIDEIQEPTDPPSIVLKYLDSHVQMESNKKRLTRPEIKQVAKCVLEALHVLHKDGMVHTDVKLNNIFFNHGEGDQRFSTIQLGDCGGVVPHYSEFAKKGNPIGAPITRSPEAMLEQPWGKPTDVWSFGYAILCLVHGDGYEHFDPEYEGIKPDNPDYDLTVLKRIYNSFGPFNVSITEIVDPSIFPVLLFLALQGPPRKPLERWSTTQIPPADNEFLRRVMKLDPRERPTVEELLQDEWFTEESEDTRDPYPVKPET